MQRPPLRSILSTFGTAIVIGLAAPTALLADPSTLLSDFGDFSDGRTQLEFDDPGLVNGSALSVVGDTELQLSVGGPASYYADPFPRESGPAGVGSVANFWGFAVPYPDLIVLFDAPMVRVGFEMRANAGDEVAIALFREGTLVDEVTVPSRGSDMLYFYGLENAAGFDEMHVDAVAHVSGAFTLDNLTYEPAEPPAGEPPAEDPVVAVYACDGFQAIPPLHLVHTPFPRALLARLMDGNGGSVGPDVIGAPPVLEVSFTPRDQDVSEDVTGELSLGAEFRYLAPRRRGEGRWFNWLISGRMNAPGTYVTTMKSGDPTSYRIDPSCSIESVVLPSQPRPGRRHGHDH